MTGVYVGITGVIADDFFSAIFVLRVLRSV